ncbi:leucyl aminopeptidase (aminopeptidase T) [Paenibacillus sacheonensis]|nr:leucyl aminopeptidase (aminopeptidase T) [Paenibacillus sacheonensis]
MDLNGCTHGQRADQTSLCGRWRSVLARYFGEFGIGLNPYIEKPMKDTLFDEKICGSYHFTPGCVPFLSPGNDNLSELHWDIVNIQRPEYGGGEIWFDDLLVQKDGVFLPEALQGLNPENLKG